MQFLFMSLSLLTAIFLILLVLVQRGRGGGLTGALGGMGGQSAFGSKAGDLFTRITIGVAAFWIILSVAAIKVLNTPETVFGDTEQTEFENTATPSSTPEIREALPRETPAESATSGDPAAAAIQPEASLAPAASTSPGTTAPAASDAPAPAASESTEPASEGAAVPEKSE